MTIVYLGSCRSTAWQILFAGLVLFSVFSTSCTQAVASIPGVNTPNGATDLSLAVQGTVGIDINANGGLPGTVPDTTVEGGLTVNKAVTIQGNGLTIGTGNAAATATAATVSEANGLLSAPICGAGQSLSKTGANSFSCINSAPSAPCIGTNALQWDGTQFQCVAMQGGNGNNGSCSDPNIGNAPLGWTGCTNSGYDASCTAAGWVILGSCGGGNG